RGSSVYSAPELFELYRAQLGLPINNENAGAIVAALVQKYQADGYARPEIRADETLLARGILGLDVYEPAITRVTFSGDRGPYAGQLDAVAERLRSSRPLRQQDLQEALQRMRTLPGLAITATTRPDDTQRNAHELAVEASFQRLEGVVQMSNRGTSEVGR